MGGRVVRNRNIFNIFNTSPIKPVVRGGRARALIKVSACWAALENVDPTLRRTQGDLFGTTKEAFLLLFLCVCHYH